MLFALFALLATPTVLAVCSTTCSPLQLFCDTSVSKSSNVSTELSATENLKKVSQQTARLKKDIPAIISSSSGGFSVNIPEETKTRMTEAGTKLKTGLEGGLSTTTDLDPCFGLEGVTSDKLVECISTKGTTSQTLLNDACTRMDHQAMIAVVTPFMRKLWGFLPASLRPVLIEVFPMFAFTTTNLGVTFSLQLGEIDIDMEFGITMDWALDKVTQQPVVRQSTCYLGGSKIFRGELQIFRAEASIGIALSVFRDSDSVPGASNTLSSSVDLFAPISFLPQLEIGASLVWAKETGDNLVNRATRFVNCAKKILILSAEADGLEPSLKQNIDAALDAIKNGITVPPGCDLTKDIIGFGVSLSIGVDASPLPSIKLIDADISEDYTYVVSPAPFNLPPGSWRYSLDKARRSCNRNCDNWDDDFISPFECVVDDKVTTDPTKCPPLPKAGPLHECPKVPTVTCPTATTRKPGRIVFEPSILPVCDRCGGKGSDDQNEEYIVSCQDETGKDLIYTDCDVENWPSAGLSVNRFSAKNVKLQLCTDTPACLPEPGLCPALGTALSTAPGMYTAPSAQAVGYLALLLLPWLLA